MKLAELLRDIEVVESHASPELEIADVAYDSRQVTKGAAFVAIRGFESDGHKYIPQVAEKGASCVICEEKPALDVPYVVVRDSRLALAVASKNCAGEVTSGYLVGVEKVDVFELARQYPEAFSKPYDPDYGVLQSAWFDLD